MTILISEQSYNHHNEVKHFESTKQGVKGLLDSGITQIPRIFHHPPENLIPVPESDPKSDPIPVFDLLGTPRAEIVEKIREASGKFGFFQLVNHGVPISLLDRLTEKIRAFHELPAHERMKHYGRNSESGCNYFSNVDLFNSKAASWKDTLQMRLGPKIVDLDAIPQICREEVVEWDREVKKLGELLQGIFSEGLGTSVDRLKELSCQEDRVMVGHYYPHCPEPNKTVGIATHTDPGVFTVHLEAVGGLQVKYEEKWVNIKPIHGAIVVNVGDMLQMISNDIYKSVDHRVCANPLQESRISIAVLFNPGMRDNLYGPLPELLSSEKPAHYRQFTCSEFLTKSITKELDGKTLTGFFRLKNE